MARVERFEDFDAWALAREMTGEVYRSTEQGPVARDFRFVSQLRAASVSVMSNIAEGFERDSLPQFAQFLNVARGSCAEVRSLLYVATDVGYFDATTVERLRSLNLRTKGAISALKTAVERRHRENLASGRVREDRSVTYDLDFDMRAAGFPAAPST